MQAIAYFQAYSLDLTISGIRGFSAPGEKATAKSPSPKAEFIDWRAERNFGKNYGQGYITPNLAPLPYGHGHYGVPIPGNEGLSDDELLTVALTKTAQAGGQGFLIASLDGPVPVMDVVGIMWASYKTIQAWEEYRLAVQ